MQVCLDRRPPTRKLRHSHFEIQTVSPEFKIVPHWLRRLRRLALVGTVLSLDDWMIGRGNLVVISPLGANVMLAAKIALE